MGLGDKVTVTPLDVARMRGQEIVVVSDRDADRKRSDDERFYAVVDRVGMVMGSISASRVVWEDTVDCYWDDRFVSAEHAYEEQAKLINKAYAAKLAS